MPIPNNASKNMLLGYHYTLRQQSKQLAKERLRYKKEETQPLRQAMLIIEHVATRRTRTTKGIVDMDQGTRTSNTQTGKVSQKTSTRLSYQSMSKGTLYQRHPKQRWWQIKHTCTQHDQIQETQGNICTGQHCRD
jgi:hypothetical protein